MICKSNNNSYHDDTSAFFRCFSKKTSHLNAVEILKCKNDYFIRLGKKFCDPSRSIKTYWTTLRTLWNGKKVPNIPPLLVNNELITEFEAKANIFNKYFASQCTTINNNSVLPSTLNHLTDDKLSSFNISSEVISQLIKNLDPNKAHGHDEISVKMLKGAL